MVISTSMDVYQAPVAMNWTLPMAISAIYQGGIESLPAFCFWVNSILRCYRKLFKANDSDLLQV
jgi:hypothetical protein